MSLIEAGLQISSHYIARYALPTHIYIEPMHGSFILELQLRLNERTHECSVIGV